MLTHCAAGYIPSYFRIGDLPTKDISVEHLQEQLISLLHDVIVF